MPVLLLLEMFSVFVVVRRAYSFDDSLVVCGVASCGVLWCDVVWSGVVWCVKLRAVLCSAVVWFDVVL